MTLEPKVIVRCPDCGAARVSPEAVTVRGCLDDGGWSYRFTCPACGRRTVADGPKKALAAAVDAGSGFEIWSLPTKPVARPDGPSFTAADELELHDLLLELDWFDELMSYEVDSGR